MKMNALQSLKSWIQAHLAERRNRRRFKRLVKDKGWTPEQAGWAVIDVEKLLREYTPPTDGS